MFSKHRPTLISPQLSYILITSCIQEFRDYVQSILLYCLRYLPINGFEFTFYRVLQLHSFNRTLLSLCMIHCFTWTESLLESDWGNRRRTSFEWSLCRITSSENLVIEIGFAWMESDWGNWTRTPFEWPLSWITSSKNFNFFCVIPLIGIICLINGVLLTDGIFQKGSYGSDERAFSSHGYNFHGFRRI